MMTYIDGQLVEKQPARVVLEAGGIGYEVFIPLSSYDLLPRVGEKCKILTYDHIREDAHVLFGFVTEDERRMFMLLLGVSGIGPKLALGVLSGLSVREIKLAISGRDVKRLNAISGIGKKTAERIVVELADKIGDAEVLEALAGASDGNSSVMRDAVMALIALGYQQAAARKMVGQVLQGGAGDVNVEDVIKKALGG